MNFSERFKGFFSSGTDPQPASKEEYLDIRGEDPRTITDGEAHAAKQEEPPAPLIFEEETPPPPVVPSEILEEPQEIIHLAARKLNIPADHVHLLPETVTPDNPIDVTMALHERVPKGHAVVFSEDRIDSQGEILKGITAITRRQFGVRFDQVATIEDTPQQ